MSDLVGIACRVRVLRVLKGFSTQELSQLASIPLVILIDVESGFREVDFEVYLRIAAALEEDPAFLLFGPYGASYFYESCSPQELERFKAATQLCSIPY